MNLQWAKASATKSRAVASFASSAAPAADSRIATRRRRPTGRRRSSRRASIHEPSLASTPPTMGATSSSIAPSCEDGVLQRLDQIDVHAVGDQHADLAALEAVRPVQQDAQRRRRLQVVRVGPGGVGRLGHLLQPQAVGHLVRPVPHRCSADATPCAARIAGVSTLLSSKMKASAMWVCSIGVWLM